MSDEMIKEKIVLYATAKFFDDGLNITMESIAQDLGMSKKTLYKHFRNKTELANEVVDGFLKRVSGIFESSFVNNKDPFIAILSAFSMFAKQIAPKMSKKLLDDIQRLEPQIWKKIDDFRIDRFKNYFPEVIKSSIRKGYIRPDINPEITILMYISSVQAIINPKVLSESSFHPEKLPHKSSLPFFTA